MTETRTKTTTARVRLTIDVEVPDTWGDECTLGQARKQAVDAALGAVRRGLILNGTEGPRGDYIPRDYANVVSVPEVTAILIHGGDEKRPR